MRSLLASLILAVTASTSQAGYTYEFWPDTGLTAPLTTLNLIEGQTVTLRVYVKVDGADLAKVTGTYQANAPNGLIVDWGFTGVGAQVENNTAGALLMSTATSGSGFAAIVGGTNGKNTGTGGAPGPLVYAEYFTDAPNGGAVNPSPMGETETSLAAVSRVTVQIPQVSNQIPIQPAASGVTINRVLVGRFTYTAAKVGTGTLNTVDGQGSVLNYVSQYTDRAPIETVDENDDPITIYQTPVATSTDLDPSAVQAILSITVSPIPEPSSMILGGIMVIGGGIGYARRRFAKGAAVVA